MRRLLALAAMAALLAPPADALELNTPPDSGGGGGGGVSSVGLALPGSFTCTGSPITSSGTITCSFTSETANTVLAAPSGGAGTPGFRALGLGDLPALANDTLYGNVSGGTAAPVALTATQLSALLSLGTAATRNVSGSGATVASTNGAFTTGDCLKAADTDGTVEDAGAACGSGGGITGVTAGTGLSGGGSSGAVTVSLAVPVAVANGGTGATTAGATAANNIGALALADNLSDLASVSTARSNLGLGTAAVQAATAFLQPANDLSDLSSTVTARSNLGLGTAAVQAATAFLQPANDLSDLSSTATARVNLGLGTAAVKAASGSGTTVASTTGSFTAGHCLEAGDSNGTVEDAGAACGSGGGGSGTVTSGTQYQLGYYAATGTTISGSASLSTNASGNLVVGSGLILTIRVIASGSSDTAAAGDRTIAWNSSTAAAKTETIPNCASTIKGQIYVVTDEIGTAATYGITIAPASAGTISGGASAVLSANYASLTLQCDGGSNWLVE